MAPRMSFNDYRKLEKYIYQDSVTINHENLYRWISAEIFFSMDDLEYAKLLRRFGMIPVDNDGNELGLDTRPSWDEYFLGIAEAVSARGDCSRRQVGAVVVDRNQRINASGYNGTHPGGPSCLKGECPRAQSDVEAGSSYDTGPGACHASHAESNALLYAGRAGTKGSVLYLTTNPCDGCLKLIKAAGIKRVVWPSGELKKKDLYGQ